MFSRGLWDAAGVALVGAAWALAGAVVLAIRAHLRRGAQDPQEQPSRSRTAARRRRQARADRLDVAGWAFLVVGGVTLAWAAFVAAKDAFWP